MQQGSIVAMIMVLYKYLFYISIILYILLSMNELFILFMISLIKGLDVKEMSKKWSFFKTTIADP